MDVEKLIECVRAHTCLYDLGHRQYKNSVLKNGLWESIGRELNQSGEAVKQKWKTIRDGYRKYKKQLKGTTGSGRKNVNYTWASQLAFLDHFNVPRASHENVPAEVVPASPPSAQSQEHTDDIPSHSSFLPPTSQISQASTEGTSSTLQAPPTSSSISQAPSASNVSLRSAKRSRGDAGTEDDVGRVLEFINSKQKNKLDVTDNLFLSYADTFKKFPPREQAIIKLEMAKLFSNIELSLLDSNSYDQFRSHTIISTPSPVYPNIIPVNNCIDQEFTTPTPQPLNLSGSNMTNMEGNDSLIDEQLLYFE